MTISQNGLEVALSGCSSLFVWNLMRRDIIGRTKVGLGGLGWILGESPGENSAFVVGPSHPYQEPELVMCIQRWDHAAKQYGVVCQLHGFELV